MWSAAQLSIRESQLAEFPRVSGDASHASLRPRRNRIRTAGSRHPFVTASQHSEAGVHVGGFMQTYQPYFPLQFHHIGLEIRIGFTRVNEEWDSIVYTWLCLKYAIKFCSAAQLDNWEPQSQQLGCSRYHKQFCKGKEECIGCPAVTSTNSVPPWHLPRCWTLYSSAWKIHWIQTLIFRFA